MSLLKEVNKSSSMNCLEQFYIQLYSYNNKLVPKQCTECISLSTFILSSVASCLHVTYTPVWPSQKFHILVLCQLLFSKFNVEHPSWCMYTGYTFSIPQRGNQSLPTLFLFYLKITEYQVLALYSHHQAL
jgi:hypothetical protein